MKELLQALSVTALLLIGACSDLTELDLLDNPNEVTSMTADPDLLYNQIQLSFVNFYHALHDITDGVMRMTSLEAFSYANALPPTVGNRAWEIAYAELLPDISLLESLDDEHRLGVHVGSAKVMQSYVLSTLVDYFGEVPLVMAGMGTDVISPEASSGEVVYHRAEQLLDEAIDILTTAGSAIPSFDNFYNGEAAKWITLARTLKLRLYNNIRLVDATARNKIDLIIAHGDLIDDPSEDFAFHWSTHRTNPDSRHPAYQEMYESTIETYLGHYFMWLVGLEKEAGDVWFPDGVEDPRWRFYFYRQIRNTHNQNPDAISCPFDFMGGLESPDHYLLVDPDLPYCIMDNGFFGRDHGNGQGIPPDEALRTVYGLYPFGGRWDNQSFLSTLNQGTDGSRGEGISPILLSSYVHFMRAEAALSMNTLDDAQEQFYLAIQASLDKVLATQSRISQAELDYWCCSSPIGPSWQSNVYLPRDDKIVAFMHFVQSQFESSPLNTAMKEFYIALWGNSIEAYNMYRRTGMPSNMQPGLDPSLIGEFPRSLLYPTDHVVLNANVQQKSLNDLVFWDDGSANVR